jgi:hypothetical protein
LVKISHSNPQILCSPWGYPAIIHLRDGKGGVVAIADTQFLLNRNIEGTEQYCPQNIGFLSRLFRQIKGENKEASPSKLTLANPGLDTGIQRLPVQKGGQ